MSHRRFIRRAALLGAALAGLLAGCNYEPGTSPLEWRLAQSTVEGVQEAGGQPSQVDGALELLFGNPQEPGYLQTAQMVEAEFYPNRTFADLSDEVAAAVREDNRIRRFKWQLELLEERRYDDVVKPLYAEDLWRTWRDEFAPLHTGEEDEAGERVAVDPDSEHPDPYFYFRVDPDAESATWHQEAAALWETWYPTLPEAADMYRQQCLHCHGAEGGGDGPTAPYLEPRPRDYRQGKYKRVAVDRNLRPRRADLLEILREGITFTAMPSFDRFSRGELEGLIDYVQLLSIRGEVEGLSVLSIEDGHLPLESIESNYQMVWDRWLKADDTVVAADVPVPPLSEWTPERIAHGRELFLGETAACATCHGTDTRGWDSREEGLAYYEPAKDDDGNEIMVLGEDGQETPLMVIKPDEWGNPSNPRNLTLGIYRFGGRPIDLFRRVKYGISGAIMPAASTELSDDDLWDIVMYVRSIAVEHDLARKTEENQARKLAAAHAREHGGGDAHSEDAGNEEPAHDGDSASEGGH